MDDAVIIELYHQRKERAIAESDRKYGRMCRALAMRLLGLREDAEECVNDTWFSAWNRMPPARPQALGAFFGRITRNLCISRWRRAHAQKRYDGMEALLSELEDCVPGPENVEETVERQGVADAISAWLDTLKPTDRWLFIRRYWYAEPVRALAAQLTVTPNTCSQRLGRLRRDLRGFLEAKGAAQ